MLKDTSWSAHCSALPVEFEFIAYVTPGIPLDSLKNVSPFGPAVLSAIINIYINILCFIYVKKTVIRLKMLKDTSWSAHYSALPAEFEFIAYVTPRIPLDSLKNVSPFGPAVLSAIMNIYINILCFII